MTGQAAGGAVGGPGPAAGGLLDDLGVPVGLRRPVRRVVSLVPSLTEALETTAPGIVVGATAWCTHPAGLSATRIGGTKNPDVAAIRDLAPDLVVANGEENRVRDLTALREAGSAVWVTGVGTVPGALASLGRLLAGCGLGRPSSRCGASRGWRWDGTPSPVTCWPGSASTTCSRDTPSATPGSTRSRCCRTTSPCCRTSRTGSPPTTAHSSSPVVPYALASGRYLTWYGPSMVQAPQMLHDTLGQPVTGAPRDG